jgi:RNA polymerase sigma factor (sigma-70 family)
MIEDTSLIQSVLSGNTKTQEIFFNKYKKVVRDYLKSKFPQVATSCDIDDCVADIMIKVFYNLDKYNPKYNFKTWVLVIAKHYMIDMWRSNPMISTCNNMIGNDDNECYYTTNTSGCVNFNENCSFTICNPDFESSSSISYLASQLSPEDNALLTMKYVQGYNYTEIGREFNLTSTTISNKVNYIKTKLKKNNPGEIPG